MGDFFLANLRWVAKDDRGCTDKLASNYNPLATVSEGCIAVGIGRNAQLNEGVNELGNISLVGSAIEIAIGAEGPHAVKVSKINGELVYAKPGVGMQKYQVPGLKSGFYVVQVQVKGQAFKKMVTVL